MGRVVDSREHAHSTVYACEHVIMIPGACVWTYVNKKEGVNMRKWKERVKTEQWEVKED